MKTSINLFRVVAICFTVLLFSGMEGCPFRRTASLTEVTPEGGSTIQADETIIAVFDREPGELHVTGADFSVAGSTVTIVGPFDPGTLTLVLSWRADGLETLTYTVKSGGTDQTLPPGGTPEGMVLIPAGEFEMGSEGADADNDEQPVHTVHVDAFYMDTHEVTNLDYKKFVLANPQWQKNNITSTLHDGDYLDHWTGNNYPTGEANHPVTYVSWYAAVAYAEWVGKRLPTEAEWEKAARGGKSGLKYPWGNTIGAGNANYDNDVGDTREVGSYGANGGLYDMSGNVWEWCLDAYDANFYFSSPDLNPLSDVNTLSNAGLIIDDYTNIQSNRVLRGGSYLEEARRVRVAERGLNSPKSTDSFNGFRCARSVTPY